MRVEVILLSSLLLSCAHSRQARRWVTIDEQVVTATEDGGQLRMKIQRRDADGRPTGEPLGEESSPLVDRSDSIAMFDASAKAWIRWRQEQPGGLMPGHCARMVTDGCRRAIPDEPCNDIATFLCEETLARAQAPEAQPAN